MKRTPRTRQSPLTLAAFRPWGSSQDGRRAGSEDECTGAAGAVGRRAVPAGRGRGAGVVVRGGFAQWPMAHAWNACWVNALAGSNPASSASADARTTAPADVRALSFGLGPDRARHPATATGTIVNLVDTRSAADLTCVNPG